MSYYAIGIGGTGVKCVESLIHSVAAGFLDDKITILLVDSDGRNGNLDRTKITLQLYKDAYQALRGSEPLIENSSLLKTRIETTKTEVWSPFDYDAKPSLQKIFSYDSLPDQERALMDVLYTEEDKKITLEKGFMGRPSVGAAALADDIDLETKEPWKSLCSQIGTDNQAKVLLIGSIFGGTGAAGLPTIASLLSKRFENRPEQFQLGCILMLPYFSFPPAESLEKAQAEADEFLLKSKVALRYYQSELDTKQIYKVVYPIGSEEQPNVKNNSVGDRTQCNPSNFVEFYAATAAIHFFNQRENGSKPYYVIARKSSSEISWNSFTENTDFERSLANLARFSYAYVGHFYPSIKNPQVSSRATWYVDFIKREGLANLKDNQDSALDRLEKYCVSFLKWLNDLHYFTDRVNLELFDTGTYKVDRNDQNIIVGLSITLDEYERLYRGQTEPDKARSFLQLSNKLDKHRPKLIRDARGVGKLIQALYQECTVS